MSGIGMYYDFRIRIPLNLYRIRYQTHILPSTLIFILIRILGIQFIDIQVLCICSIYSKSPSAMLIMTNRDPRDFWFSTSDHIPARSYKVGHVSKRRSRLSSMWIICHNRISRFGTRTIYHPIITTYIADFIFEPFIIVSKICVSQITIGFQSILMTCDYILRLKYDRFSICMIWSYYIIF